MQQAYSWDGKIERVLKAIAVIQGRRHTVSMQELAEACGVTRQTVSTWLREAEKAGYVDLHNGEPRAIELLPWAWQTVLAKKRRKRRGLFKV